MPASDVLSAADVIELQALVVDLSFPDVFQVQRDTATSDNAGGYTLTPTTVASGPCRLRAVGSGAERQVADRLGWQTPYAVDLHPDVVLSTSDRLIVNGRPLEIGGVVRAGVWSMTMTAVVQEVG